ncbi:MAG: hypothetical protein HY721_05815 [Planctomycetes bacterium]|nr:hypothetical protein [Planctomycetota bacterium]
MRTTIVLKDPTAERLKELARKEDRKLSNMISVLITEAIEERQRAALRSSHFLSVMKRLQALAPPEEHRRAARMLREEMDG